jgi:hypothetical protein
MVATVVVMLVPDRVWALLRDVFRRSEPVEEQTEAEDLTRTGP